MTAFFLFVILAPALVIGAILAGLMILGTALIVFTVRAALGLIELVATARVVRP